MLISEVVMRHDSVNPGLGECNASAFTSPTASRLLHFRSFVVSVASIVVAMLVVGGVDGVVCDGGDGFNYQQCWCIALAPGMKTPWIIAGKGLGRSEMLHAGAIADGG